MPRRSITGTVISPRGWGCGPKARGSPLARRQRVIVGGRGLRSARRDPVTIGRAGNLSARLDLVPPHRFLRGASLPPRSRVESATWGGACRHTGGPYRSTRPRVRGGYLIVRAPPMLPSRPMRSGVAWRPMESSGPRSRGGAGGTPVLAGACRYRVVKEHGRGGRPARGDPHRVGHGWRVVPAGVVRNLGPSESTRKNNLAQNSRRARKALGCRGLGSRGIRGSRRAAV
jgi:hypothetical protein